MSGGHITLPFSRRLFQNQQELTTTININEKAQQLHLPSEVAGTDLIEINETFRNSICRLQIGRVHHRIKFLLLGVCYPPLLHIHTCQLKFFLPHDNHKQLAIVSKWNVYQKLVLGDQSGGICINVLERHLSLLDSCMSLKKHGSH